MVFKEVVVEIIQKYFGKFDCKDILVFIIVVISLKVEEFVFELQIKIKLGLINIVLNGVII